MKVEYRDPLVHIAMGARLRVCVYLGTDRIEGMRYREFGGLPADRDLARNFIADAFTRSDTYKVTVFAMAGGLQIVPLQIVCTHDGDQQLRLLDAA